MHENTDKCMNKSIDFEQISDCSASTTTLSPIQSTVPKRKSAIGGSYFSWLHMNIILQNIFVNLNFVVYILFQFHHIKGYAIFVGKRNLQCNTAENKVKGGDKQLLTKLPFKKLWVYQQ